MRKVLCVMIGLSVSAAAAQELLKDPIEILKKADAATKAVKSVQYDADFKGYGAMEDRSARVKGTAIIGGGTDKTANQSLPTPLHDTGTSGGRTK